VNPQRQFACDIVNRLRQAGYPSLFAGGCVRDELLGLTPDDYDVATSATPEQVRAVFGPRRTRAVGESFGVVLVVGPREAGQVEVATFRTEGPYSDGRRPDSVSYGTPEQDARRRDFTINGMFLDPQTGEVLDFVGGRDDLASKTVRSIGSPHVRIAEDKLRMLRAVRMTARFGFELDAETAAAVQKHSAELAVVSAERITQELKKMLVHFRRAQAMELSRRLELLPWILPELAPFFGTDGGTSEWQRTLRLLDALPDPGFELAFAALLSAVHRPMSPSTDGIRVSAPEWVAALGRRLRLSNDEIDAVGWLLSQRRGLALPGALSVPQWKRLAASPRFGQLLVFARKESEVLGESLAGVEAVEAFLRSTSPEDLNPPALLTGEELIAAGMKPGPDFKRWLNAVRDAQLAGEIETLPQALDLVERLRLR
jgi:tRNA nucleotidyltransferase/poly(A) polymerase